MAMRAEERERLITRYEAGPAVLSAALERVPAAAMTFRPTPDAWSAHEIVVHCADSETNAHGRIRYLAAESDPLIVGYDQEAWARIFDYHARPLPPALATVAAVRANTTALIRAFSEETWTRAGRHSDSGSYAAEDWLRIYAAHLHDHADQIAANLAAWEARER